MRKCPRCPISNLREILRILFPIPGALMRDKNSGYVTCWVCDGEGKKKCRRCNGTGIFRNGGTCRDCGGSKFVQCPSSDCAGKGYCTCPKCKGAGEI